MVWSGTSTSGRTDLHVFRNRILMAQRYADEVYRSQAVPYAEAIGYLFLLMLDTSRPHTARLVENMLETETIHHMEWSERCPT